MNMYLKFYEFSGITSSVTPCEDTVDMKRVVMRCYCSEAVTNRSVLHFKKAASHPKA